MKVGTYLFQEAVLALESFRLCPEDKANAAGAMVLEAMLDH